MGNGRGKVFSSVLLFVFVFFSLCCGMFCVFCALVCVSCVCLCVRVHFFFFLSPSASVFDCIFLKFLRRVVSFPAVDRENVLVAFVIRASDDFSRV